MARKKPKLTKTALRKYVKQNKSTRFIAQYFHVSERTLYRRIQKWNLKGLRPKGRKPLPIVKPIPIPEGWITSDSYIDKLNKQYHFTNITYLPTKYVNTNTRVCSDKKENPKGKFESCTIYYVALHSDYYFLYPMQIQYSRKGASFDEIYHYFSNKGFDLIKAKTKNILNFYPIDISAFHFIAKIEESIPEGTKLKNHAFLMRKLNGKHIGRKRRRKHG